MRIAQIAPLYETVPPRLYGGTERIVSFLTEELVRLGHEVTLFACEGSRTKARFVPCCSKPLRMDKRQGNDIAYHIAMLEKMAGQSDQFDVVHAHIDYLAFPYARRIKPPMIFTLHGRLDLAHLNPIYEEFNDLSLVSISNVQRGPLAGVRWLATIPHGLPPDHFSAQEHPGSYLAFLGRISPEKRVDLAIQIAREAGMTIRIAAKIDPADQEYFKTIEPLFQDPGIEFIGEIDDEKKISFLKNAHCLLFPIDWPEPFGLVLIEAMACGTPVIAFRRASVPEIVETGVTGFIVDTPAEAVKAIEKIPLLNRQEIRRRFKERFTVDRMAHDYLKVFERLAKKPALAA
jgi:glycosyltransferase involved in cell wall biosynthesis